MAGKNVDSSAEEEKNEGAIKPKKKGKLVLVIVILVLLGAGGGGAWWFLKGTKQANPKEAAAHKTPDESKPPIYAQLDKELTTGLTRTDGEDHYLQLEIKMKVADVHVSEKITQRAPEIRSALLLLMTSKSADDLKAVEDKQKLADEMAVQINKIIRSANPKVDGVLGVYFTTFILQ